MEIILPIEFDVKKIKENNQKFFKQRIIAAIFVVSVRQTK